MAEDVRVARLIADLELEVAGFRRDLRRAEQQLQSSGKRMQSRAALIGKRLLPALGFAGIAFAVKSGVANAIKEASRAEEIQSKFATVFRGSVRETDKWATELGDAVGRSTTDIRDMASQIQDILVPALGTDARDAAAELSKQMVELGIDLASFNNLADQDAITRLISGLVGQTESVRRFGIDISVAALQQELLNQGIKTNIQFATRQQKVMAIVGKSFKDTTDAQGDAIRTADQYANSLKAMEGAWQELQEAMGETILPAATETVQALTGAFRDLRNMVAFFRDNESLNIGGLLAKGSVVQAQIDRLEAQLRRERERQRLGEGPTVADAFMQFLGVDTKGDIQALINIRKAELAEINRLLDTEIDLADKGGKGKPGPKEGPTSAQVKSAEKLRAVLQDVNTTFEELRIAALNEDLREFETDRLAALIDFAKRSEELAEISNQGIDVQAAQVKSSQLYVEQLLAIDKAQKAAIISGFDLKEVMSDAFTTITSSIERFSTAIIQGEADFRSFVSSVVAGLARIAAEAGGRAIVGAILAGLGGLRGGGVAVPVGSTSNNAGGIFQAASGGILTQDAFGLAHKGEVIAPLDTLRGLIGGGGTVVNVFAPPGDEVDVQEQVRNGQRMINVIVGKAVDAVAANVMAGQSVQRAIETRNTGLSRRGIQR